MIPVGYTIAWFGIIPSSRGHLVGLRAALPGLSTWQVMVAARTIVASLIAGDLFFYQLIRQAASLLIVPMSIELGYTQAEKGRLLAAPSLGAIATQAVGGAISSRLGARLTVMLSLTGMAVCCMLLPAACTLSFSAGVAVLGLNGLAYGPMFPTNAVLLSRWMLPSERGWASTQSELAISIASTFAPLLVTTIEPLVGWRACFWCIGLACLLYAVVWMVLAASSPSQCWFASKTELALLSGIAGSTPTTDATSPPPTTVRSSQVLLHPSILVLFLVHGVYNLGTLSINSWMPTYYAEVLVLSAADAKLHLMLPHIVATLAKLAVPSIAASIRGRGASLLASRKIMCMAGFAGTAAALTLLPYLLTHSSTTSTTACFCFALALTGMHAEGCVCLPLKPRRHSLARQQMHPRSPPCAAQSGPTISTSQTPTWALSARWGTVSHRSRQCSPRSW